MNKSFQARQGDALITFRKIEGKVKTKRGKGHLERMVLHGESSDHGHFVSPEADICEMEDGRLFVDGNGDLTEVKHDLLSNGNWTGEHNTITIPAGYTVEVTNQQEYDPYANVIRQVRD